MSRIWILQANPKLYDVDGALHAREILYWRIPQYTAEVRSNDLALIWRSGKEAGFVGWGKLLADPQHYDQSAEADPFARGLQASETYLYAPVRVWPGSHVPKADVAAVLPGHQIVTAPMGTVFRLDADDTEALRPLLAAHGYELDRPPGVDFIPLPVRPEVNPDPVPPAGAASVPAHITPALFLLSSTPERPTEITIEGDALRLMLVEREALKSLDDSWDSVGIYLLIGRSSADEAELSVYVGKAQGLRSRIKTHQQKEWQWQRALLVQRPGLHPFNASDISWLERRLIDVLLEAPQVDLINKTPPPVEFVPDYKSQILERTVVAVLAVLGLLGAFVT